MEWIAVNILRLYAHFFTKYCVRSQLQSRGMGRNGKSAVFALYYSQSNGLICTWVHRGLNKNLKHIRPGRTLVYRNLSHRRCKMDDMWIIWCISSIDYNPKHLSNDVTMIRSHKVNLVYLVSLKIHLHFDINRIKKIPTSNIFQR